MSKKVPAGLVSKLIYVPKTLNTKISIEASHESISKGRKVVTDEICPILLGEAISAREKKRNGKGK